MIEVGRKFSCPEEGLKYYKNLAESRDSSCKWMFTDPKYLMYYAISLGSEPESREFAQEMVFVNTANPNLSNEAWLHAGDRCGFGEEGERWTLINPNL